MDLHLDSGLLTAMLAPIFVREDGSILDGHASSMLIIGLANGQSVELVLPGSAIVVMMGRQAQGFVKGAEHGILSMRSMDGVYRTWYGNMVLADSVSADIYLSKRQSCSAGRGGCMLYNPIAGTELYMLQRRTSVHKRGDVADAENTLQAENELLHNRTAGADTEHIFELIEKAAETEKKEGEAVLARHVSRYTSAKGSCACAQSKTSALVSMFENLTLSTLGDCGAYVSMGAGANISLLPTSQAHAIAEATGASPEGIIIGDKAFHKFTPSAGQQEISYLTKAVKSVLQECPFPRCDQFVQHWVSELQADLVRALFTCQAGLAGAHSNTNVLIHEPPSVSLVNTSSISNSTSIFLFSELIKFYSIIKYCFFL